MEKLASRTLRFLCIWLDRNILRLCGLNNRDKDITLLERRTIRRNSPKQQVSRAKHQVMKKLLGTLLLGAALFAAIPAQSAQVSVGIQIGAPPPPRVLRVRPVQPGPDYLWIDGYWYPVNGRYIWHQGYWTRPPYPGAHWIGPRHDGGRFYGGYWDGPHGRFDHDHHWDHNHDRDRDRWHDHH